MLHDINNHLGVIINYNALARRRDSDPTITADLDEVHDAAIRIAALIESHMPALLAFDERHGLGDR